jgi:hypothetical protein
MAERMKSHILLLGFLCATVVRADGLADPTRPMQAGAVRVPQAAGKLKVEAIFISKERTWAIVNGTVVRAGDRIGKAHIEEIFRDGVRYTSDGQSRVSRLDQSSIRVRGTVAPSKDES